MTSQRYVVFDDAPQDHSFGWTADHFADALRAPLAAIGVRVIRQHGDRAASARAGFQAHGWSRGRYAAKLNRVGDVVNGIMVRSIAEDPGFAPEAKEIAP
jgi:hypothetical protein